METFGRIVLGCIVIVLVGTGLYYALNDSLRDFHGTSLAAAVAVATSTPIVIAPGAAPVPVLVALNPAPFDEVGTIIYYIEQGVEVPYLIYVNGGTTYSKALEFSGESICVTSVEGPCPATTDALKTQYGSGPVEVQGTPDDESLLVTRIATVQV